jgi:hypothetical protein
MAIFWAAFFARKVCIAGVRMAAHKIITIPANTRIR